MREIRGTGLCLVCRSLLVSGLASRGRVTTWEYHGGRAGGAPDLSQTVIISPDPKDQRPEAPKIPKTRKTPKGAWNHALLMPSCSRTVTAGVELAGRRAAFQRKGGGGWVRPVRSVE